MKGLRALAMRSMKYLVLVLLAVAIGVAIALATSPNSLR